MTITSHIDIFAEILNSSFFTMKQSEIKKKYPYVERDISWMYFNQRILLEAARPEVPLLERLTFLGIYSNNLDEFFRVRVATLNRIVEYADKNIPTFVEMIFSYNNELYTIRRNPEYLRPAKKGNGFVKEKAQAEFYPPNQQPITGIKEVNSAINELIGLDVNQFTQIAMIAQGEFLKLIHASTKERSDIFRKIFNSWFMLTSCPVFSLS